MFRPAPRRPLVPVALAALAGVGLGSFLSPWPALALLVALPLALIRGRRSSSVRASTALAILSLLGVMGLYALNASLTRRAQAQRPVLPSGLRLLDAELLSEPVPTRGRQVRMVVEQGGARIALSAPEPQFGRWLPGARVRALGRFRPWRTASDPGGYDPGRAAARRGVDVRFAAAWVLELEPRNGPRTLLAACRRAVRQLIDRGTGETRPLFRAVLLGERVALPDSTRRAFALTGTAHLLSISGLHVGLIAGLVLFGLRVCRLSPMEQRVGVLLALLAYLLLVGPRVPTLRATIAGAAFFALPGRGDAWNRLALALLAVLAWDPAAPWEIGFQLSFGTVAAILALGPSALRAARTWLPAHPRLGSTLAGAVVCFAASAPLLGLCFGAIPLVAIVLGVPTVAVFSLLLGLSLVAVAVGIVSPDLGVALFGLASHIADGLVLLVEGAAQVPGASLDVIPAAGPGAVLGVGLIALGVARRAAGGSGRWLLLAGALLVAAVLSVPGRGSPTLLLRQRGRTLIVDRGRGPLLGLGRTGGGRWLRRVKQERRRADLRWSEAPGAGVGLRAPVSPGVSLLTVAGSRVLIVEGDPALRPLLRDPPRVDVLVASGVSARNAVRLQAVDARLRLVRRRDAVDVVLEPAGPRLVLR